MTRDPKQRLQVSLEYLKAGHEFFKHFMIVALASVTVLTAFIGAVLGKHPPWWLTVIIVAAYGGYSLSLAAAIWGMYVTNRRIWSMLEVDLSDKQPMVKWFRAVMGLYAVGFVASAAVVLATFAFI